MTVRAQVENAENAQEGGGPRMPDQRRITRKFMNGNPTSRLLTATHVTLGGKNPATHVTLNKKSHPLPQPPFIPVTIPNPRSFPTATHVIESR